MVRTQIQLTEGQAATLRQMAAVRRKSVAELIRFSVDLLIRQSSIGTASLQDRAKNVAGRFASGSPEGSQDHDRHVADAFAKR
jgi:hypothetical protein